MGRLTDRVCSTEDQASYPDGPAPLPDVTEAQHTTAESDLACMGPTAGTTAPTPTWSGTDDPATRLQSTLGNQGTGALLNGQAPDALLSGLGLPPSTTAPDAGKATDLGPDAPVAPDSEGQTPEGQTPDGPTSQGPASEGQTSQGATSAGPASGQDPLMSEGSPTSQGPSTSRGPSTSDSPVSREPDAPGESPASGPGPQSSGPVSEGDTDSPDTSTPTGAADLDSGALDLISHELAEHEHWASAAETVGGAGSQDRAAFIAQQVGAGEITGFETGLGMGVGIALGVQATEAGLKFLAKKAVPGVGAVIGGVLSARALAQSWDKYGEAVGKMGEGRSGYEVAANDIEGVCALLDAASNILNVLAGVAGVVAVAATALTILSLGALTPLALAAGSIATAIGVAGGVLATVKMAVQPLVVLFRSLHAFTSEADPREIEAQGKVLAESGAELGGALGGIAGTKLHQTVTGHGAPPPQEHEGPAPQAGPKPDVPEGPLVVAAEPLPSGVKPATPAEPVPAGTTPPAPVESIPLGAPPESPLPALEPHPVDLPPSSGPTPELAGPPKGTARSDNMYEVSAGAVEKMRGPLGKADPTRIQFDDNIKLSKDAQVQLRQADAADVFASWETNPVTGEPRITAPDKPYRPGSMIPEGVGADAPPPTRLDAHGNLVPDPITGLRTHADSPNLRNKVSPHTDPADPLNPMNAHNSNNPVTIINTEGQQSYNPETGRFGSRFAPEAHMPAGGRDRGPTGYGETPDAAAGAEPRGVPYDNPGAKPGETWTLENWQNGTAPDPVTGAPVGGPKNQALRRAGDELPADWTPENIGRDLDAAFAGMDPQIPPSGRGGPSGPARRTDVDWSNPKVLEALGIDPVTGKPSGSTLKGPGKLEIDPSRGSYDNPAPGQTSGPYHGALGKFVDGEYAPEGFFEVTEAPGYAVRVGPPGSWVDHIFPTLAEAEAYAAQAATRSEAQIREASALPVGWAPDASGKSWAGNPVDAVRILEVPAGTPTIRSVVAPQPEGMPGPGRPAVWGGGGWQTQLPVGVFPRGATP
ncbi:MAG TPA: hypothetical protein VFP72_05940, partial [Kineosporiaceae bacterium]|nr:hypothetical protein [Kineosporiaceae bacterium]